jgi:hypothetical protein
MTYRAGNGKMDFSTTAFHCHKPTEIDKNGRFPAVTGMGVIEKVRENGTYYLRAKVAGKCVYASLKTTSLKITNIKRNTRLPSELEPRHILKSSPK